MKYQLRLIDWKTGQTTLKYLREKVFVLEWQLPSSLEFDCNDENAFHVVATDSDGNDIATARLTRSGEIGRIAVKPSHRSFPLYKALFSKLMRLARQHKIDNVYVRCNLDGVAKMTQHGFQPEGRVFMEGGIPMQRLAYPAANPIHVPDIKLLH